MTWKWIGRTPIGGSKDSGAASRVSSTAFVHHGRKVLTSLSYLVYLVYMPDESGCCYGEHEDDSLVPICGTP